ncbi:MAG TPA: ABC transporter ATP-binding protein [Solirubrobacteraceae bacterium]|jgi:ABC-type lipoprotein export system ATPase subunit|nr:ABC transporter ATP-binding protein [Solirubrobacteraceae bacterium]
MTAVATATSTLTRCENVEVTHRQGEDRITALRGIDLDIAPGEHVALWGRSGSGKTTLLHVLGGLVVPSAGRVLWRGEPLSSLDAVARGRARAGSIAYVFQGANLLEHFSALENLVFALSVAGPPAQGQSAHSPEDLLALVGLGDKLDSLPAELSGGEAQRVAIARALAQHPQLLLCDEPTGHLDSATGVRVLDLIDALAQEFGFALVTATHDVDVAARAERIVELRDGQIVKDDRP